MAKKKTIDVDDLPADTWDEKVKKARVTHEAGFDAVDTSYPSNPHRETISFRVQADASYLVDSFLIYLAEHFQPIPLDEGMVTLETDWTASQYGGWSAGSCIVKVPNRICRPGFFIELLVRGTSNTKLKGR